MTAKLFDPTPATGNPAHSLESQQLAILLGGLGWVGRDLCRTVQQRALLISHAARTKDIATKHTALWVHTGITTLQLSREQSFFGADDARPDGQRSHSAAPIPPVDLVRIGRLTLTTPERTALDLMATDIETGMGAALALIRSGVSLHALRSRADALRRITGMKRVRQVLAQIPDSIVEDLTKGAYAPLAG